MVGVTDVRLKTKAVACGTAPAENPRKESEQERDVPKAFERLAPMAGGGVEKVKNDGRWERDEERKGINQLAAVYGASHLDAATFVQRPI